MARVLWISVLALAMALVPACASGGGKGEATGTSLGRAAEAIEKGQGQIDAVLAALGELGGANGSDLPAQFKAFQKSLGQLASTAKDVASKADRMQRDGQAYFKGWDADLASIGDEGVRARSEARRNEIKQEFDSIAARYQEAAAEFKPFMATLRDIETALKLDLTAQGVQSLAPVVKRAGDEAVKVKASLARLSQDFRDLSGQLAATSVGG